MAGNLIGTINPVSQRLVGTLNVYTMETGDGRELELSVVNGYICWRRVNDVAWQNLVSLQDLKPIKGVDYFNSTDKQSITNEIIANINNVLPISAITGLQAALDSKAEISDEIQAGSLMSVTSTGILECSGLLADDVATKDELDDKLDIDDLEEITNLEFLALWNQHIN